MVGTTISHYKVIYKVIEKIDPGGMGAERYIECHTGPQFNLSEVHINKEAN